MATKKKINTNPVFKHKNSLSLVDTADDLVDSLDNLSDCLKHIEEREVQNKAKNSTGETSLYQKLKENLDVVRDLTDTLKQEKWRLSRRQMSVELRMGELEDYKSHMKQDMTDMNQTAESLSMRLMQLENALVEAKGLQEHTEAERAVTQLRLDETEKTIKDFEDKQVEMVEEMRLLKSERKDTILKRQHSELVDRVEILMLENKSLKELIREKDETDQQKETNADSVTDSSRNIVRENNNKCDDNMADQDRQKSQCPSVFTKTSEMSFV